MSEVKWRWIYASSSALCLLFLVGCEGGMSADEMKFVDNPAAVKEYKTQVEMTEKIRAGELAEDQHLQAAAQARDVGPINEVVRHRERAKSVDGSTPVVDIGPPAELERHRQGGCVTCGTR